MKIMATLWVMVMSLSIFSQDIEALEKDIKNRVKDTSLVNDYLILGEHYTKTDSLKTFKYNSLARNISFELDYKKGIAQSAYQLGLSNYFHGSIPQSYSYFKEGINAYRELGDKKNEFKCIMWLTIAYEKNNENEVALKELKKLIEVKKGDDYFQYLINNKIGSLLKGIGEYESALKYYNASDRYYSKIDTTEYEIIMAQLSNDKNRGVILRNNEKFDSADYFLKKSLNKSIEVNDSAWMARNYNSIGILYKMKNDLENAILYFEKSLALKKRLNYSDGVITTLTNLGSIYRNNKNYQQALVYLSEADSLSKIGIELGRVGNVKIELSLLYADLNKFEEAYKNLVKYLNIKDSLNTEEQSNVAKEIEAKYQNKSFQMEQEKLKAELEASDLREQNKSAQIQEQKNYLLLGSAAGGLLLILVAFVVRSNIKRKKINQKLEQKNNEVLSKNARIEQQSELLEEKNHEIMDSITYAQRIQQAILPGESLVNKLLPNSFILYRPKDVLAGDFYWVEQMNDLVIWAAADCTGHGVPGAMVSVVCHNALNKSVFELGHTDPADILNSTREIVTNAFQKGGTDVKDGMDIALCCLHVPSMTLKFAGANNPLWIISENQEAQEEEPYFLTEIKGDKQPIGHHYSPEPFTSHEIKLKKNDQIFAFSDGYPDQFGGEKGKKLKNKYFKKLILESAHLSMKEKLAHLNSNFDEWKGTFEQIDDVCVIGVRM